MPEWVKGLRESARKTVISPITKRDYVIRKMTTTELIACGLSPVVTGSKVTIPKENVDAAGIMAAIGRMQSAIQNGVIDPKIVYCEESQVPEGSVHAAWISEDESWLYLSILQFSGIADDTQRQQLDDILKNVNGSGTSLQSAAISENSPATC